MLLQSASEQAQDSYGCFVYTNFLLAGELEHLLGAEMWPEVHQLLVKGLAAELFLGTPENVATLRGALSFLHSNSGGIDAALGAGSYRLGAGLYTAYYALSQVSSCICQKFCELQELNNRP